MNKITNKYKLSIFYFEGAVLATGAGYCMLKILKNSDLIIYFNMLNFVKNKINEIGKMFCNVKE